jgi:hypothetical protein
VSRLQSAKLQWYFERLRVMRPAEVAHRVGERSRQVMYRRRPPSVALAHLEHGGPQLFAPLLRSLASVPGTDAYWRQAATTIRSGSVSLLGQTWPATKTPDWRRDPVSERRWPMDYAFDIDYRHGSDSLGEAKYVWELNRLLYLLPIAAHAAATDDAELAALARCHVDDWLLSNPPYYGVAWASGIEVALRLVAMLTVEEILAEVGVAGGFAERVHIGVLQHVDWLTRFPSKYSSANNHRVAELGGLLLAAAKHPSVARRLNVRALLAELNTVAAAQFFADGVGAEQSSSYAAFTLEWLAITAHVAATAGWPISAELTSTMTRAANALRDFTDVNGNLVRYGDDDEGRVLTAAVPPEQFSAGVMTLLPSNVATSPPSQGVRSFPQSGYVVARTIEDEHEALWVFDHGPLGFGEIAAHGHADALSVWLHYGGKPVFVDAGTYLYHSGGPWRDYFRGTSAHNTVTFAGLPSSVTAGNFNWRRGSRAKAWCVAVDPTAWSVEGAHDGYVSRLGVVHRRRIERVGPGHFRITDTASGDSATSAQWSLLLAPDLRAHQRADGWIIRRGDVPIATVRSGSGWAVSTLRGSQAPLGGWHSARFGELSASDQLLLTGALGDGAELVVDVHLGVGP